MKQSATNISLKLKIMKAEKVRLIDFKSQLRMKALKKVSCGKIVKLLYVAACVGLFLEEAYECLVHYVSK